MLRGAHLHGHLTHKQLEVLGGVVQPARRPLGRDPRPPACATRHPLTVRNAAIPRTSHRCTTLRLPPPLRAPEARIKVDRSRCLSGAPSSEQQEL